MAIKHGNQTLFVPESRAHLLTEVINTIKSGKAKAFTGSIPALRTFEDDFISANGGTISKDTIRTVYFPRFTTPDYKIKFAKDQESNKIPNMGYVDFKTSYTQAHGWGFDGTIGVEWAKRQETAERRMTAKDKLLRNGVSISFGVTVTCAKEGEKKNIYMKIIDIPDIGRIYLPSRHEDTFQNLEDQIISGEAKFI